MKKEQMYFKNLDTIRFAAAMMVLVQHVLVPSLKHLDIEGSFLHKLLSVVFNGGTGVSLFFVLSGFLITFLIITEVEGNGSLNIKKFYLRRFLRIWPLYFAVLVFTFLLYPGLKTVLGVNTPLGSNILYHLLFLSNFDLINIKDNCDGLDAMSQTITWSVSIEEQFYLFWPLLFLLPKKSWLYIIVGLITFSVAFRLANAENTIINYFHTFSVLVDLVVGGFFAFLIKRFDKVRSAFENSNTLSHSVLFVVIFLVLYFGTGFMFGSYSGSMGRLVTAVLFASAIASQALTQQNSPLNLSRFKFASKWGKVTYGIYLLHPIAITIADVLCRVLKFDYKLSFYTEFGVGLVVCILTFVMSKISFDYYESRFLRLKTKFQTVDTHTPENP